MCISALILHFFFVTIVYPTENSKQLKAHFVFRMVNKRIVVFNSNLKHSRDFILTFVQIRFIRVENGECNSSKILFVYYFNANHVLHSYLVMCLSHVYIQEKKKEKNRNSFPWLTVSFANNLSNFSQTEFVLDFFSFYLSVTKFPDCVTQNALKTNFIHDGIQIE